MNSHPEVALESFLTFGKIIHLKIIPKVDLVHDQHYIWCVKNECNICWIHILPTRYLRNAYLVTLDRTSVNFALWFPTNIYWSDFTINTIKIIGRQNQITTPKNKKKAAKVGAKVGQFGAMFGLGQLTDNVDMGGFENMAKGKK